MITNRLLDKISEIMSRAFERSTQESLLRGAQEMRALSEEYENNEEAIYEIKYQTEMIMNYIVGDETLATNS